ncbi:MAG: hypothetical protein QG670_2849 [Thermoproteota archaeon]|nr:hypothetical protein [Thermoproteota archaeon]
MDALLFRNIAQFGPPNGAGLLRYLWIPLVILVLVVIIVLYRLLFPNLQKVRVNNNVEEKTIVKKDFKNTTKEAITKSIEQIDSNTQDLASRQAALQFLEADERKIIEGLLEAKGSMLQKEISWKTGFSRVKTHRVLARLIRRGVVTAEKYYNTNKIVLSESIFDKKNKTI